MPQMFSIKGGIITMTIYNAEMVHFDPLFSRINGKCTICFAKIEFTFFLFLSFDNLAHILLLTFWTQNFILAVTSYYRIFQP